MRVLRTRWRELVLVVAAYGPLMLTRPGVVNADIKQYLHLDAGSLLASAPQLWNPDFGLGTVTHQNIGYLFPAGPFYWLGQTLGLADWLIQRLWYGSILVMAGLGVLALIRRVAPDHPTHLTGAMVYMLSPFLLGHLTGQSALLLPFSLFPWLVLAMATAVASGGWRWPAIFALLVTVAGSINGSSIFFVVLGAVLWAPVAAWSDPAISQSQAGRAVLRAGVLTLATQLWWMVALAIGGWHGLPILSLTETLTSTNNTTSSFEVLRGLGYWFFYGRDPGGLWLAGLADPYMERLWLLLVSFGLAGLCLLGMALVRWQHRAYFALISVVGLVISVGSFRHGGRSPYGSLFNWAAGFSDLVFSLRNTQRAAPLLVLGMAVFAATALQAGWVRFPRLAWGSNALVLVLVVANLPGLWNGSLIAERFHREEIPTYWEEAAADLNTGDPQSRVMEIPGVDFASYRWGHTLDPITPGLIERPYVARELLPHGDQSGANLLVAFDRSMQEGWFEPAALPEIARLLGVGDVVLRSDLEYERYRTARPRPLWAMLVDPPEGLASPRAFGEPVPNVAGEEHPMFDELELGIPLDAVDPPPVAIFAVEDSLGMVRARPVDSSLVVSGDGEGLVALAAAGLLDAADGVVRYAASVKSLSPTDRLAVTDTNRERAERWYAMNANVGYTEPLGAASLFPDVSDVRIRPVDGAPTTHAEYRVVSAEGEDLGFASVGATGYGNRVFLNPEFRPVNAFDGDPLTSWRIEEYGEAVPPELVLSLSAPTTLNGITFTQPLVGPQDRRVRTLSVVLDGEPGFLVELDARSYVLGGQTVAIGERSMQTASFTFVDGLGPPGPAGFAEIDLGLVVDEVLRVPTEVLSVSNDVDHDVAVVLTRHRTNPAEPVRPDPERIIDRVLDLPSERSWWGEATVRLADWAPDQMLDEILGVPNAEQGGVTARSSDRLAGDLRARALAAIDGDPGTHWSPEFLEQTGQWVSYTVADPITVNRLDLLVVADQHHSIPTRLTVAVDGQEVSLDLPPITPGETLGHVVAVPLVLPQPLTGRTVTVTIAAVKEKETDNWYTGSEVVMPVALAEIGIASLVAPPVPGVFDSGCRTDLVTINGQPVGLRVTGDRATALAGQGLLAVFCDQSLALPAGDTRVQTVDGRFTGFNIDRIVLRSGVGGAATGQWSNPAGELSAQVTVTHQGRSALSAQISQEGESFWLVLGQSFNEGWVASVNGEDLGTPQLVDGFANGWLVNPSAPGQLAVEFRWEPQRLVNRGLIVSALAIFLCLTLAWRGRRFSSAAIRSAPPKLLGAQTHVALSQTMALQVALSMGLLGALVSRPWVGVLVAIMGWLSARSTRWRLAPLVLAALAYGGGVAYIIFLQIRWEYEPSFAWPSWGRSAHHFGLLAVLLLMVNVMVQATVERADPEGNL